MNLIDLVLIIYNFKQLYSSNFIDLKRLLQRNYYDWNTKLFITITYYAAVQNMQKTYCVIYCFFTDYNYFNKRVV